MSGALIIRVMAVVGSVVLVVAAVVVTLRGRLVVPVATLGRARVATVVSAGDVIRALTALVVVILRVNAVIPAVTSMVAVVRVIRGV